MHTDLYEYPDVFIQVCMKYEHTGMQTARQYANRYSYRSVCSYSYANIQVREMREDRLRAAGCGTTASVQKGTQNAKSTLKSLMEKNMGKRPILRLYSHS